MSGRGTSSGEGSARGRSPPPPQRVVADTDTDMPASGASSRASSSSRERTRSRTQGSLNEGQKKVLERFYATKASSSTTAQTTSAPTSPKKVKTKKPKMPPPPPMKPLSPQSELNQSFVILQRLIEGRCLPSRYLGLLRTALEKDEKEIKTMTVPSAEETAIVDHYRTMAIPAVGTRRKRDSEGESTELATKRPCAYSPLPYPSALPQREEMTSATLPPPPPPSPPPPSGPASSYASAAGRSPSGASSLAGRRPTSSTPPLTGQAQSPPASVAPPPDSGPAPIQKIRYPPLIVESLTNWSTHFKTLKERLGHAPNARPFGKGVRFSPETANEYRMIQAYLTELEKTEPVTWFSYSLPEDRSLKVAIRGLPADTPTSEIASELRGLGFEPEAIRAIQASKGRPGCIFFAMMKQTANLTPAIYNITELLCMPGVIIESWNSKKGPAQCHRCQAFRHSSHNCHRPIACVRCGGHHYAADCPRPREMPPTCVNCEGAHTANSKTCPAFRKEARNRRAGTTAYTASAAPALHRARSRSGGNRPPPSAPETRASTQPPLDSVGGSLMAPANLPTARSAPLKVKKKKMLRKKKNLQFYDADTDAPSTTDPRPPRRVTPAVAPSRTSAPPPGTAQTAPQDQPKNKGRLPRTPPPQVPYDRSFIS
ncbi:Gag-like protein [Operophtera brumata]|uniref:Gag-like protein n=1 Tax=Operophtera brumata TaxID=104452 RepID=A0A0L7L3U1_OPEBR|nr:Gag-like protein [Operophtera brumata]